MSDIKIKFEQNGFVIAGLPIVCVEVLNNEYKWVEMYFLVDSGANVCQLSENALERLKLDFTESELPIYGVSGFVDSPKECDINIRDIDTKQEFVCDKFSIVPDDVFNIINDDCRIHVDGIIGSNFLFENKFIIDYTTCELKCLLMEK
jgi:hypothetical protein